jgi:L-2-hydroxyglutarate oxidase LhgO
MIVVVGGGIIGLATARALLRARPGLGVTVLEKEDAVGTHQTGHSSYVLHSGVYYAPGSLKARLCVEGVKLMRAFCAEHDVPIVDCGKLVVAVRHAELDKLDELHRRATANGVPGLRMLDGDGIRELEPHTAGVRALHVPGTSVVDYRLVSERLAAEIARLGGEVRTGTTVSCSTPRAAVSGRATSSPARASTPTASRA